MLREDARQVRVVWKPRIIRGGREGDRERPRVPAPAGATMPAAGDASDAELVHRVLQGLPPDGRPGVLPGHDAFAVLVERHQGQVLRLAAHLLRDADAARDVAQDAFLRAYRSLGSFRPDLSFRNWILRIAVNAARDHQGRWAARHLRSLDDIPEPRSEDVEGQLHDALLAARVRICVSQLSVREREVFVLRDLEGLDVEEVAAMLALEPPTIRRHLARARLRLRRILSEPVPSDATP